MVGNKSMTNTAVHYTEPKAGFAFLCLLLYTVVLFIRPQEWSSGGASFPFPRVMLILAFLGYLVSLKPKPVGHIGTCLILMIIVILLSGLRNGWFGGAVTEAIDFFIYGVLPFLLYAGLANTRNRQLWLFVVMQIASMFMLHHGITQKASPDGIGWTGAGLSQGTRITYVGFFNDPNDLGMFLIMNMPLAIYFAKLSDKLIVKLLFYSICVGLFYGVLLTNSRGALLGSMSLVVLLIYFRYGAIKTFFVGAILAPVAYVLMSMFRTIDSKEESAYGRIEAWYDGVQMFKSRPLLGVGKGGFVEHHHLTAHNSYVLVMAELGTLGYVLWFVAVATGLIMLIRVLQLNEKVKELSEDVKKDVFLAKCLLFSFTGFLTTAFFLSRTYIVFLYIFLGLSFALYLRVLSAHPEVSYGVIQGLWGKLISFAIVSLIGLYFIIIILL